MYRFLATPRWIGLCVLMLLATGTMVRLGLWQLDRYHSRSATNARIEAAAQAPPAPLASVLHVPPGAAVGAPPAEGAVWQRVSATGRFDRTHEILARARTVNSQVGFEVITPLVLADGSAILVDRGFLPATPAGPLVAPPVPAAPAGEVGVTGWVRRPESRAGAPEPVGGQLMVRRIAPAAMAAGMPYPLYGAYLAQDSQDPPADPAFTPIPPDRENAIMNAGYVVQWWAFALLTLVGLWYVVTRQARDPRPRSQDPGSIATTVAISSAPAADLSGR